MSKYERVIHYDGSLALYPHIIGAKPILIRENYARHYRAIATSREFAASLRAGGYEIAFICDDGGTLCHDCAHKEAPLIMRAIRDHDRGGWRVTGLFSMSETDSFVQCDNCNRVLQEEWQADIEEDSE